MLVTSTMPSMARLAVTLTVRQHSLRWSAAIERRSTRPRHHLKRSPVLSRLYDDNSCLGMCAKGQLMEQAKAPRVLRRIAVFGGGGVLLLIAAGAVAISTCNPCGNSLMASIVAPDAATVATVFRRNCGATTGYSYHLWIHDPEDKLDDKRVGNALVAVGPRGSSTWRFDPTLDWTAHNHLRVRLTVDTEVRSKVDAVDGVSVEILRK